MSWYFFATLAALVAMANGQSVTPTNWTDANQSEQVSDSIGVSVSVGDNMMPLGPILALTQRAHTGIPPTGLSGPVFLLDPSTQLQLSANDVALISCDPQPGNIQASSVFGVAEKTNVTSIVFYSEQSDYCMLSDYEGSYAWIYTTKSRPETTQLLDKINSPDSNSDGRVYVSINTLDLSAHNGSAGAGSGDSNDNNNPLGPSPSTAVAMIILYSITGIITALFLLIIVTGAVRAHRHPERYGPRNLVGRPRQSRARGLARAIVETLPIVKFGEQQEPKPTDVELADSGASREGTPDRSVPSGDDSANESQQTPAEQPTESRRSVEGGIAAAVTTDQGKSAADKPENQGCSICTEDFEAGQDQRVLPCDHRFHPECIDPWLLNVSGTCPLCRIDLQPQNEDSAENNEVDENGNPVSREVESSNNLAPPLASTEASGPSRMGIRRSLLIGLMGARGADRMRVERMTQEERVQAAQQLRQQQLAQRRESQNQSGETGEQEQSRRARLRRAFGIRTRRTGQESDGDEAEASSSRDQEQGQGDSAR